jgi:hypothetical protein
MLVLLYLESVELKFAPLQARVQMNPPLDPDVSRPNSETGMYVHVCMWRYRPTESKGSGSGRVAKPAIYKIDLGGSIVIMANRDSEVKQKEH